MCHNFYNSKNMSLTTSLNIDFYLIYDILMLPHYFRIFLRVYYALLRTILLSVAIYCIAIIIVLNDYSEIVW